MSERVFRYGGRPPMQQEALVRSQMRLAHAYRNDLVQIERGRRAAIREAIAQAGDVPALSRAVVAAEEMLERSLAVVRTSKVKARSRNAATPELRASVEQARKVLREAKRALAEARKRVREDETIVRRCDEINELAGELRRSARAYCGVYWGTYLRIEAAMQASSQMPLYDGAEPNDPRFVRWSGEGTIAIQLQHGLDPSKLLEGKDTRARLRPMPPSADGKCGKNIYLLELRIGTAAKRQPIFATFSVRLHRPFPEGAIIRWIAVHCRRHASNERWYVDFTISVPEVVRAADDPTAPKGAVGIDVGWRVIGDEIRVARWSDDSNGEGELRLPAALIRELRYADTLRALRDEKFNLAIGFIVGFLAEVPAGVVVPEWFKRERFSQWRSCARLESFVRYWRSHRFAGDEDLFIALEAWRYRDSHLWHFEVGQRRKALGQRRDLYRVFASKLAKTYALVVLPKFDRSKIARRPNLERPEKHQVEKARSNRHLVATSELEGAIKNACVVEYVAPENVTLTCSQCQIIQQFDAAKELVHTCPNGHVWDQDDNAATNILNRRVLKPDAPSPTPTDTKEVKRNERWLRARRGQAERTERTQKSKSPSDNAAE